MLQEYAHLRRSDWQRRYCLARVGSIRCVEEDLVVVQRPLIVLLSVFCGAADEVELAASLVGLPLEFSHECGWRDWRKTNKSNSACSPAKRQHPSLRLTVWVVNHIIPTVRAVQCRRCIFTDAILRTQVLSLPYREKGKRKKEQAKTDEFRNCEVKSKVSGHALRPRLLLSESAA
jgi:hypothetical protein